MQLFFQKSGAILRRERIVSFEWNEAGIYTPTNLLNYANGIYVKEPKYDYILRIFTPESRNYPVSFLSLNPVFNPFDRVIDQRIKSNKNQIITFNQIFLF